MARTPEGDRRDPDWLVRLARPDDAWGIAQAHVVTWQVAYRGQIPEDHLAGLSVAHRATTWRRRVLEADPPSRGVHVATRSDRVVGFVQFGPSPDDDAGPGTGEIGALYVVPDHWARGLGRALLEAALASLRAAGCARATLWVLDTNARARAFYDAGGWRADGAARHERRGGAVQQELRYGLDLLDR